MLKLILSLVIVILLIQIQLSDLQKIIVPITWNDVPEHQYPFNGEDYNIKCAVTANPAPIVHWFQNGDEIKTGGRYVVGDTGLYIKNVRKSDDGAYLCRAVVLQTGELAERLIRVKVVIKPEIQPLPEFVDIVHGDVLNIKCNSTGKPIPRFTWIKDLTQEIVGASDRFSVNPETGLLTIDPVQLKDDGVYTCRAENIGGISESAMLLNVMVHPVIYEFLNITSEVRRETTIICKAFGRPIPEITLQKLGAQDMYISGNQPNDDRIISELRTNEKLSEASRTIRILQTVKSDDGLYECVARNRDNIAKKLGHLTVQHPPLFDHMNIFPPVYSWDQKTANLSCFAQAIPNATIQWIWHDRRITETSDPNLKIEHNGVRSDLIVTPIDRRYYSSYKCVAVNFFGRNEYVMELREAEKPDIVPAAKPNSVTTTSITFEIQSPPTQFGLPVFAYRCQFKENTLPDWTFTGNHTWLPDSPYIIEGLKPQTLYDFRFAAENVVGLGRWGAYVSHATAQDVSA